MKDYIPLTSLEKTLEAGYNLGLLIQESPIKLLCFYGNLGSGKTTFIRGFVSAFKNQEKAEVASPTFTLINTYPTLPPIFHGDMYRLGEMKSNTNTHNFIHMPEELEEALEESLEEKSLVLIEWAEYLNPLHLPEERLDIYLKTCKNIHSLFMKSNDLICQQLIQKWEVAFIK